MPQIDEREILDVIRAIEAGAVTVTKSDPWNYEGNDCPVFTTSNGWRFVVFNDVDEWDYFESITAPNGRRLARAEMDEMPVLKRYWPESLDALKRWGFDDDEATNCLASTLRARRPCS